MDSLYEEDAKMAIEITAGEDPEKIRRLTAYAYKHNVLYPQANNAAEKLKYKKWTGTPSPEIQWARDYVSQMQSTYTPPSSEIMARLENEAYGTGARKKGRTAYLFLGHPGSGKSTIAEELAEETGALLIDSDRVAMRLPGYAEGYGAGVVFKDAIRITSEVLKRAVINGDDIVLPRVGTVSHEILTLVEGLKSAGYIVHVIYVDLPIDKCLQRTIARFYEGGPFIDPDYVRSTELTPKKTYAMLRDRKVVDSYGGFFTNVPRGERAILRKCSESFPRELRIRGQDVRGSR